VKAATYIECTAAGSNDKVWGVGIHHDVVQASLIALLSAASSFLTSRASTPALFRPIRMDTLTEADIEALEKLNGSAIHPNGLSINPTIPAYGTRPKRVDLELMESRAVNGNEK